MCTPTPHSHRHWLCTRKYPCVCSHSLTYILNFAWLYSSLLNCLLSDMHSCVCMHTHTQSCRHICMLTHAIYVYTLSFTGGPSKMPLPQACRSHTRTGAQTPQPCGHPSLPLAPSPGFVPLRVLRGGVETNLTVSLLQRDPRGSWGRGAY